MVRLEVPAFTGSVCHTSNGLSKSPLLETVSLHQHAQDHQEGMPGPCRIFIVGPLLAPESRCQPCDT